METFDRAIDLRIARLRRKIEKDAAHPEAIRTVRGVGICSSPSNCVCSVSVRAPPACDRLTALPRTEGLAMRDGFLWLLIAAYALVTVIVDGAPATFASPASLPLAILIPLLFALVHGTIRYGASGIAVFLVLCLGISNVMENVGVLTGFPFGRYYYTDVLGPKLFLVPLLIGPAYFGTGYLSWVLATVLLDADRRRDALATVAVPVVATFIMVGWDVCLDPGSSTIGGIWIWQDGGPYFGVPFGNYLGWALTVFLFFMAFALYRAARPEPERVVPASYWYQACVLFAVMALDYPAGYFGTANKTVTDPTGRVWQTADIMGTAAVVSLFTMLFVAVTCFCLLLLRRRKT